MPYVKQFYCVLVSICLLVFIVSCIGPSTTTTPPTSATAPATEPVSKPSTTPTEEETTSPTVPAPPQKETSTPTSALDVMETSVVLQEGNNLPKIRLRYLNEQQLVNNYIGTDLGSYNPGYANTQVVYPIGFKWVRISFTKDPLNWQYVENQPGKYQIDSGVDEAITNYNRNGVNIVLNLGVGTGENRPDQTRFNTEAEISRYKEYVRFMVRHFKGRIRYYEIWNEPDTNTSWGGISVDKYSSIIRQVVPVIREEYSEAKIVIGAIGGNNVPSFPGYGQSLRYELDTGYLRYLLKSGVAPLVDVISWHPFYGHRPDDPYYQDYPKTVETIKELAVTEGFKGEYLVEEIVWRTPNDPADEFLQRVTEIVATKYYSRSIIINRGLGLTVSISLPGAHEPSSTKVRAIHHICTVMAGAEPTSLPINIKGKAKNIKSYAFSLSNGDHLIALWTDGIAADDDPGVEATLTMPSLSARKVIGIDVLYGFEQELVTNAEDGNTVISNLLIRDYPLILRLTGVMSSSP